MTETTCQEGLQASGQLRVRDLGRVGPSASCKGSCHGVLPMVASSFGPWGCGQAVCVMKLACVTSPCRQQCFPTSMGWQHDDQIPWPTHVIHDPNSRIAAAIMLRGIAPSAKCPSLQRSLSLHLHFLPQCHLGLKLGRKLARQNVNNTGIGS